MDTIKHIFIFIHQDFNRLGFIGETKQMWWLDPQSYNRYTSMRHHQRQVIKEISDNKHAALFVFPHIFNLLDIYHDLPLADRNTLESQLQDIADWAKQLTNRFVLLKDSDFKDFELGLADPDFARKLPFMYSPKTTKISAFGEYTSHCVTDYGQAIYQSLGIPKRNFQIIREASIENIQLFHESDQEFYSHLPGWQKERQ